METQVEYRQLLEIAYGIMAIEEVENECSLLKSSEQDSYWDYLLKIFQIPELVQDEVETLRRTWLKKHGVYRDSGVSLSERERLLYGRVINSDYSMSIVIRTISEVLEGKRGKEAAKVFAAAENMRLLLSMPSFDTATRAFGMTGSKTAYENYKGGFSAQEFKPYQHYNGPLKLDTGLRQIKTLNFVVEYGKDITQKVHA